MNAVDPRLAIGGNSPPLALTIRENHNDVFTRLDELAAADALVPAVITSDEDEGKAQDIVLQCKKTVKHAEAMHKLEKEPYDKAVKEIKATFAIPIEKVEKVAKTITERLDVYKEKKAAEERRRREEEARRQREEAERLQREAEEAERRQREAAEARRLEEERAARAQAEREKAEREAKEARERAERLREEQARMEEERRQRKIRDEQEAAKKAELDAAETARRKAEEEAHIKRMAELKAQRAEEDRKAAETRVAAQKALEERREAEAAAAAAKRDEKSAAREAGNNLDDAVRLEKRADRLDDAAQASESDLSRGRGEYGSVGSRVTTWKWRMINRDDVPLETLRAYMHPDAIDAAVTRFMNAHRPELGTGRDFNNLLRGVEFFQEQTTRVA